MQPAPGSHCHSFHELLGKVTPVFDTAQDVLNRFVASPDFDVDAELARITELMGNAQNEYSAQAQKMISDWVRENRHWSVSFNAEDHVRVLPNGRVCIGEKVDGNLHGELYITQTSYFPSLVQKIELRSFRVYSQNLTALDYIEEVAGFFDIENASNLNSMKRLRKVDGIVIKGQTGIQELPELEDARWTTVEKTDAKINFPKMAKVNAVDIDEAPMGEYPLVKSLNRVRVSKPKGEIVPLATLQDINGNRHPDVQVDGFPVVAAFLPEGVKFRDIFPNLRVINGKTWTGISIQVDSGKVAEEVEQLRKAGELSFSGDIRKL